MNLFKKNQLNEYPCDLYLHSALRHLRELDIEGAYEEICWAIIKSGGTISGIESDSWKRIMETGSITTYE